MRVSVVGIDADDTLWRTAHLYDDAIREFVEVLVAWDPCRAREEPLSTSVAQLTEAHYAAAPRYGVGALAMLRTMVEAAVSSGLDGAGPACEKALKLVEIIHEDGARPFAEVGAMLAKLREKGAAPGAHHSGLSSRADRQT